MFESTCSIRNHILVKLAPQILFLPVILFFFSCGVCHYKCCITMLLYRCILESMQSASKTNQPNAIIELPRSRKGRPDPYYFHPKKNCNYERSDKWQYCNNVELLLFPVSIKLSCIFICKRWGAIYYMT